MQRSTSPSQTDADTRRCAAPALRRGAPSRTAARRTRRRARAAARRRVGPSRLAPWFTTRWPTPTAWPRDCITTSGARTRRGARPPSSASRTRCAALLGGRSDACGAWCRRCRVAADAPPAAGGVQVPPAGLLVLQLRQKRPGAPLRRAKRASSERKPRPRRARPRCRLSAAPRGTRRADYEEEAAERGRHQHHRVVHQEEGALFLRRALRSPGH